MCPPVPARTPYLCLNKIHVLLSERMLLKHPHRLQQHFLGSTRPELPALSAPLLVVPCAPAMRQFWIPLCWANLGPSAQYCVAGPRDPLLLLFLPVH